MKSRQKLKAKISTSTHAVFEGSMVKHDNLKVWTGYVPNTPIEEVVDQARHYAR